MLIGSKGSRTYSGNSGGSGGSGGSGRRTADSSNKITADSYKSPYRLIDNNII